MAADVTEELPSPGLPSAATTALTDNNWDLIAQVFLQTGPIGPSLSLD